jgi:hypothetical protein
VVGGARGVGGPKSGDSQYIAKNFVYEIANIKFPALSTTTTSNSHSSFEVISRTQTETQAAFGCKTFLPTENSSLKKSMELQEEEKMAGRKKGISHNSLRIQFNQNINHLR